MILSFSVLSCKKDLEEPFVTGPKYTGNDTLLAVRDFIWKGLNEYYLWQPEVTNLQDNRFGGLAKTNAEKNTNYKNFLRSFSSNEELFYSLLNKYQRVDRFSYITKDYTKLEEQFKGITASTGMNYIGGRARRLNNRFVLLVRYVVPGSEADQQGVQRGHSQKRRNPIRK